MDANSLMLGMLAGIVGGAYVMYGRKASKLVPVLSGIGLIIYPYLFDSVWALLTIGAALCALPFVFRDA